MLVLLLAATFVTVPQDASAAAAPAKIEKKICRYDIATGSIMPGKRVCHTATEWRDSDGKNGDEADRFRQRPQVQPSRPTEF